MLAVLRNLAIQLCAIALLIPAIAVSQLPADDIQGVRIFEPLYFIEFDPLTALDMVNRMPGFSTQESEGGRGLSGVRSNILIDGERPPPKGQSIRQQLGQMPVEGVDRIELIDAGARLDIDMQGYPQVVNVVTVANPPTYYEVISEIQRSGDGDVRQENERMARVEGTSTFYLDDHEFSLRGRFQDRSNRSPADFVAIDPANPEQRISSLNNTDNAEEGLQFDAVLALPAEGTLTINSSFGTNDWVSAPISLPGDVDAVNEAYDYDDQRQDLSAEYRRPVAENGELMLAVVDGVFRENSESSLTSSTVSRSSLNDRENGETAARALLTNNPTDRLTVRTTVSNAFNYFEGGFRIFENGTELDIAGADSRVEEDRRSIDASVDWNLTEKWIFRGTLGAETYVIETREASSGSQTDPKGEISITYRPQPRTTLTIQTSRAVGQLSFGQFLASSSLSSEILTAGATELEPERRRTHSASYDRRFSDRGVFRLSLSRDETENPVSSVALTDAIIVSQNTSPEIVDRLQGSFEYPFERFGQEDLVLSLGGMISDSETIDPVTGEVREVSGSPKQFTQVELRRNPGDGKWSWGISRRRVIQRGNFSVRQTRGPRSDGEWRANVQWEPIDGLRFGTNIQGPRTQTRTTNFFAAVRETGLDPSFIATTTTHTGRSLSFSVQWRRRDRFEITASLSSRPERRTEESLTPFGESVGSILATEIDRTPRAMLRFRILS